MADKKMMKFRTADLALFNVEECVTSQWKVLSPIMEQGYDGMVIPLFNISSDIFSKVIEYCRFHQTATKQAQETVYNWNNNFLGVDYHAVFGLNMAATFLQIESLFELTCDWIAKQMAGKTPREIRRMFDIQNEFTEEEEAELRKENPWLSF